VKALLSDMWIAENRYPLLFSIQATMILPKVIRNLKNTSEKFLQLGAQSAIVVCLIEQKFCAW
jgi:hypothetical protein